MNLIECKNFLDDYKVDLNTQVNLRDDLMQRIKSLESKISDNKSLKNKLVKSIALLNRIALEKKKEFFDFLEVTATTFIQEIYGDDYAVFFDTHDEQREKGKNDFKCEIRIRSVYNGALLETGVVNSRGGGLIEVVGLAFSFALLKFKGYQGPVLLDETLKHLSADDKIIKLASFLKEYSESENIQLIFTSHRVDVFGKPANQIFQVKHNEEKHALVVEMNYDDLMNEMNLSEDIEAIDER
jgi:hypothetical protein